MTSETISGIHHITAIASDPQQNLSFYAGVLGMRLVKRTINFDDASTYHFYFGDELGRPGTLITFFPWSRMPRGRRGAGEVTAIALAVPEGALDHWRRRLDDEGVTHRSGASGFDSESIAFSDPDGLELELVESPEASTTDGWSKGPVPRDVAIRGIHAARITVDDPERTRELLVQVMGFHEHERIGRKKLSAGESERTRFVSAARGVGSFVDLVAERSLRGRLGAGSVHHIAWRVPDDASQLRWRERIAGAGLSPTRVLDRQYFRSIYFREPGGVLFEIATDPPGFTTDEAPEELGSSLKLPPWYEERRSWIEPALPALRMPRTARA